MPSTKLQQFVVHFDNSEEYHHVKNEVFTQDLYYLELDVPQPVIIDAGAHIGLSTLYFKRIYPGAVIHAVEPLQQNRLLLEKNVFENNLSDVYVYDYALSDKVGEEIFFRDIEHNWYSTAGFLPGAWTGTQLTAPIIVKTNTLQHLITEINLPIDILKLDIEGAEEKVLRTAHSVLHRVKHMLIEFHPHDSQSLERLVTFLDSHGFRVELHHNGKPVTLKKAKGLILITAEQRLGAQKPA